MCHCMCSGAHGKVREVHPIHHACIITPRAQIDTRVKLSSFVSSRETPAINRAFVSATPINHTYSQLIRSDCAYSEEVAHASR